MQIPEPDQTHCIRMSKGKDQVICLLASILSDSYGHNYLRTAVLDRYMHISCRYTRSTENDFLIGKKLAFIKSPP